MNDQPQPAAAQPLTALPAECCATCHFWRPLPGAAMPRIDPATGTPDGPMPAIVCLADPITPFAVKVPKKIVAVNDVGFEIQVIFAYGQPHPTAVCRHWLARKGVPPGIHPQ